MCFSLALVLIAYSMTQTLDYFLQCTEKYLIEVDTSEPPEPMSESIVFIDSKDITTITDGTSPPITSCPTAFCGHSIHEIHGWFETNISQPRANGYLHHCYLILDDKSAEDDTCIFVCTLDSAPGEIKSLRCGFEIALQTAHVCGIGGDSIEEGVMGSFMRSGVTMTKENLKLARNRGRYIENGEVKVDQAWKDFINW